ncbi:MAG: 4-(cytidine 5'-diphospho)-2-C-methyl-D-erythritol kinase [Pirellulales bacterium]|nr:4-(cytidine 5'-diphospho)-2-C-methyl-D-erythritol kinase [Pirellulales bacterium]
MFPCKVGSAWEVVAPAKLNLYLDVLGGRPDGFHELETLMLPVRIYDSLRWTAASPEENGVAPALRIRNLLSGADAPQPDLGPGNLVLRAAESLARAAGIAPCGTFELIKRIPIQAGMGGGSSDAAAALLLANAAWGIGYSYERLASLAGELGSDIPFFLQSSAAICRGRGEQVEPVAGLPLLHFVVVKPPVGLSTAEVFSRWRRSSDQPATLRRETERIETGDRPLSKLIASLRHGALAESGIWMQNALESAAAELSPWINRLRQVFAECGCYAHGMTGSGSATFGVMRSARQARRTAQLLATRRLGTVLVTASC